MELNEEKIKEMLRIANEIFLFSRNTLLINLRFMDVAISRLKGELYGESYLCDNKAIYYNPVYLIRDYKKSPNRPVRAYLHMVLHCVFRHMFIDKLVDERCWNIACDIAIENTINEMGDRYTESENLIQQNILIKKIKDEIKQVTAEKVYRYLLENYKDNDEKLSEYERVFTIDDHSLWYLSDKGKADLNVPGYGDGSTEGESSDNSAYKQDTNLEGSTMNSKEDWKSISEHIQEDLKTFSKERGNAAGALMQNLAELNREKYNYESFLKKFSVMGEAMQINDDEFDYIFYAYGLDLYKNMPLIEPLEYKEVKRIKEFVIAIDTSGSVNGEEVQSFVQKTYNILETTQSFFTKINLHIIQCDATIQEHVKITSKEEFDQYIKQFKIKGLGGTDFRPVFSEVDQMVKNREFSNLKGLIYFTDGYGVFPGKKPDYNTAFVFVNDDVEFTPIVPPWAIKLVLQRHEL